jgi:prepilin-type N-terminal cleavage/methylation domain-containing protein
MKGFTLFETILVLIIISVILGFGFYYFNQKSQMNFLFEETNKRILDLTKTAREKAILGEENSDWGVSFVNTSTDYVLLYKGTPTNIYFQFTLNKRFSFVNPPEGSSLSITFSKFKGFPSISTTISIKNSLTNEIRYLCIPSSSSPFLSATSSCLEF